MATTARLYDLQMLDLEIAARREALQDIEGRLGESEALLTARAALADAQGALKERELGRRDLETGVEDLGARLAPLDKKLYGGSVRSPKELQDLQTEVTHLRSLVSQKEDALLEAMEAAEEAQRQARAAQATLAEVDTAWRREHAELLDQQRSLRDELAAIEAQRAELAAALDAPSLSLYEVLRAAKQGRAVAVVARGTCQACRVGLPLVEVQRVRSGLELVTCSSCGRILHVA